MRTEHQTLQLDLNTALLNVAEQSAKRQGVSLSTLIENALIKYLSIPQQLSLKHKTFTAEHEKITSKLRGIITLPEEYDYKKELEDRIL
ncbi:MAG: DUF6364 family protein [Prevotellaceae bacterium]|jgi:hypothetical protein|nr:DUF6364 family protein [Prevotellaceae bacterium]